MKKHLISIAALCLALMGCANIEYDSPAGLDKHRVLLTGACETKTSLGTEADGDISILWTAGDMLGIYVQENDVAVADAQNQLARLVKGASNGPGYSKGSFETFFALKGAAEYRLSIYYPYSSESGDMSSIRHTIPAFQTQSAVSESKHFGLSGCFAYAEASFSTPQDMDYYDTPEVGFELVYKTSAMWLKVKSDAALNGWKIKTVRVTAPEGISLAGDAEYTPSSDVFSYSGNGSRTITLNVPGGAVLSDSEYVNLYLVAMPAELAGKALEIEYVLENASASATKVLTHTKVIGENSSAFASGSIHRFVEVLPASDAEGWVYSAADAAFDLSANGTANCYIVSTPGKYSFDATVIGNGQKGIMLPTSTTHFHTENATIAPASVKLVWQTAKGLIKDLALTSDGKVVFTKADSSYGNAMIAVMGSDGSILWSWHIWCTDTGDLHTYVSRTGTYEGMDRNLGATYSSSSVVTDEDLRTRTVGMYYQWGRKDPFPGPAVQTSSAASSGAVENYTTELMPLYDADGKDYARPGKVAGSKTTIGGVLKSIEYTIQNPSKFVYCGSNTDYDWFATCGKGTGVQKRGYYLWGNPRGYEYDSSSKPSISKTIYDPCPPGYMVPPADFYTAYNVKSTSDYGAVVTTDGGSTESYLPYASGLQGNASKGTSLCSKWIGDGKCYMWTSSFRSEDDDRNWCLTLKSSVSGYTTFIQAYGFPIRCIQEF